MLLSTLCSTTRTVFIPKKHLTVFEMTRYLLLRKSSPFVHQDPAADYTTLFRRIRLFELPWIDSDQSSGKDVIIAIEHGDQGNQPWRMDAGEVADSSGLDQVHVVIDRESWNIVAMEITDETTTDESRVKFILQYNCRRKKEILDWMTSFSLPYEINFNKNRKNISNGHKPCQ
jgi:hypothetical protein